MNGLKLTKSVFVFGLIMMGALLVPSLTESARAQQCIIQIAKVAEEGGDTLFPFEISVDSGDPAFGSLPDGGTTKVPFSSSAVVTELPLLRWALDDVVCQGDGGITFDITENGFTAQCVTGDFSTATCTFINVPAVANIPTLSEWGMISAAAGLVLIGVFFAVRRRRAAV